jgi:predicted O-methyltransferase YrrM
MTRAPNLPLDLEARRDAAWQAVRETPGYLTEREAKFLMLAAVASPARGAVLEIGSFKGRSTVGLGLIVQHYGGGPIVAVDPFTAPSSTDPELEGQSSTYEDFQASLRRAGVTDMVESHRMFSRQLAPQWSRPLRLLWIDGDHTYEGALEDVRLFKPFLAEGGILAMHDVLSRFPGSTRVFLDEVLRHDDFGPAGYSGTIGWAQYRPRDGARPEFRRRRNRLARTTERLLRVLERGQPTGLRRLPHKLWRALTPHDAVDPVQWISEVGTGPS